MEFTLLPGDAVGECSGDNGIDGVFDAGDGSDFDTITSTNVLPLQLAAAAAIRTSLGSHNRVRLVSIIKTKSLQ